MREYDDLSRTINIRLLEMGKDRKWLIEEVRKQGLYCDASIVSRIATGERYGGKTKEVILEILGITEEKRYQINAVD